eukprot:11155535-Lingulodinium_polyedra.AAC.1
MRQRSLWPQWGAHWTLEIAKLGCPRLAANGWPTWPAGQTRATMHPMARGALTCAGAAGGNTLTITDT